MNAYWQNIFALGIVAAATMHLATRVWSLFAKKEQSGCGGGCHGCGGNSAGTTPTETIVSIESLNPSRGATRPRG